MPKRRSTKGRPTPKSCPTERSNQDEGEVEVKRSKYFKNDQNLNQSLGSQPAEGEANIGDGEKPSTTKTHSPDPEAEKSNMRCPSSFFNQPCQNLAKKLLGKTLVRVLESGEKLSGVIVETEAYIGGEDKGSHSFNGKRTARNEAMYMVPGTTYVYHIYGMYTCINISSQGDGAAVLIRGLDAVEGISTMRNLRGKKRSDGGSKLKLHELCNGPSKLTQALHISKSLFDQQDISSHGQIWVEMEEGEEISDNDIVSCSRIGIDYAGEWSKKPLRYYVIGRKGVSVRDKEAEANLR